MGSGVGMEGLAPYLECGADGAACGFGLILLVFNLTAWDTSILKPN